MTKVRFFCTFNFDTDMIDFIREHIPISCDLSQNDTIHEKLLDFIIIKTVDNVTQSET